ncbi:NAD(P)/FAD-dependent oxidoreductase [Rhodococcus sp. X156]|uniref:flavin-containing monooxygenase n=1 Tax=Rhodococcus sp. X156 TaxID=2499145 RepID=UPI000FD9A480|nr:NAD(P)/FAD-dependent oxidoreductase [Rhodococcus sp. X156]
MTFWPRGSTPRTVERHRPRIVIIGAGLSGITALHVFTEHGFTDVTVVDKASDVGGVWHWNRYPGLTCDVPSQLYQFRFAPKPDWSHVWASGAEIQQYHRDVVDDLHLDRHLRLNTEVVSAQWSEERSSYTLTTAEGEYLEAEVVICATGILHHPATPQIPGLDTFTGPVVHTARWDSELDLRGRAVAVVGTGSTGVQIVSALQPEAAAITHFVRTPQWILWAPMSLRQLGAVGTLLRRSPALHRTLYDTLLLGSGFLADITTRPSWRRRLVQAYARLSLRAQVRNPQLRRQLTPDDEPLCKRPVVSGTYYRAIQRRNAALVTEKIVEVTPDGITTADGTHHPADAIILATGFDAHSYMRPMTITGPGGTTLDELWAQGPRAYRMTAIPGLPNLFTILGPNSPTGSISLQYSAERTARYLVHLLELLATGTATSITVTEEATDEFNHSVADAMGPTVWNTGCNSWYLTESGAVDLWPFDKPTLAAMLDEPTLEHFTLR